MKGVRRKTINQCTNSRDLRGPLPGFSRRTGAARPWGWVSRWQRGRLALGSPGCGGDRSLHPVTVPQHPWCSPGYRSLWVPLERCLPARGSGDGASTVSSLAGLYIRAFPLPSFLLLSALKNPGYKNTHFSWVHFKCQPLRVGEG